MSRHFSRRDFGRTAALGALGSSAGLNSARADDRAPTSGGSYYQFPAGFRWGCATASYQIEGGVHEGGRAASVWDAFSHSPGHVDNNDTGDVADDEYHRYSDDIRLLKSIGASVYRYSVAWPRVFPEGTGQPNAKGMAYYDRVTDDLLASGIEPFVTMFHWDLPQAMQDRFGGWESKETSKAFADYAGFVAGRLSDRVHNFFTTNEFSCFTDDGYGSGTKAPGLRLPPARLNQVRHNAILGHGLAVQAIRASARPGTKVGVAENPRLCVPVIESREHIQAAQRAMRDLNAHFLTAVMEGRYLDSYLSREGANAPKYSANEMRIIGSPLDFVGLNIYQPTWIRADDSPAGYAVVPNPSSYPRMASEWLTIGPEIAYWAPRHVGEIWKVRESYITENGCSSADQVAQDGHVYDTDRVMYVRNHLIHGHRAVTEGWPLHGYFWWSLLDNFEWSDGYGKRFGIYYVDFKTEKRIPKMSASFYREVIARNAVV